MNPLRRSLPLLAATALCAVPASAVAAPSTCSASLPGPQGSSWQLAADGSLQTRLAIGEDRAFAAGHGKLTVGGSAYPAIPNVPMACDRTGDVLTYPTRQLGPWAVSRSVSVVDGRLRHLDTVTNTGDQLQNAVVEQALEITGAQVGFESESGDANATHKDHWFALRDDTIFPVVQWGPHADQGGQPREEPFVKEGDAETWSPGFSDGDESARLAYTQADVSAGETVRILQVSDVAPDAAAATTLGKDQAGSFRGYTKAVARTVINYGTDPDLDGVAAKDDDCPGVAGDGTNGCTKLIAVPTPTDPVPAPGDPVPPAPAPAPGPGVVPVPGPVTGTTPTPQDRTAPKLTLGGLPSAVKRRTLATTGVAPRIGCDEACAIVVQVEVRRRGARKATRIATITSPRSAKARTVRVKLGARKLVRLQRQQVTVRVVATDAAGNKTSRTGTVALRR